MALEPSLVAPVAWDGIDAVLGLLIHAVRAPERREWGPRDGRLSRQPQVGEDFLDGRVPVDQGHEAPFPSAAIAGQHLDGKGAAQQRGPGQPIGTPRHCRQWVRPGFFREVAVAEAAEGACCCVAIDRSSVAIGRSAVTICGSGAAAAAGHGSGMMRFRCLLCGAKMPWKRVK